MVILGIAGTLSSGKDLIVSHLEQTYNFQPINLNTTNPENIESLSYESSPLQLIEEPIHFIKTKELLQKLKEDRKVNYMIYPIQYIDQLKALRTDPYFFLLGIDAPVQSRYRNFVKKHGKPTDQLRGFIAKDDNSKFLTNISQILFSSDRIIHNTGSKEELYTQIDTIDILNFAHIRPSIDIYYARMAELVSKRAGCLHHKNGCIITNNNRIVSTGYSGILKTHIQCVDGGCEVCYHNLPGECICTHAELGTIIEGKIAKVKGSTMYVRLFPCIFCAQAIIQAKIALVVYSDEQSFDENVKEYMEKAGVKVKMVSIVV
ncbi:hypothetical protein SteCoe_7725 [Stentor coeruleus]|uniref:dCMP deaminase n=1 Tax=Stentor coeruleus TaxID=5963 RepID=A0A1R2CLZ2_9CILI|nr:hypothetical protein SteCoe_7725 [Stentor coeruleus]